MNIKIENLLKVKIERFFNQNKIFCGCENQKTMVYEDDPSVLDVVTKQKVLVRNSLNHCQLNGSA